MVRITAVLFLRVLVAIGLLPVSGVIFGGLVFAENSSSLELRAEKLNFIGLELVRGGELDKILFDPISEDFPGGELEIASKLVVHPLVKSVRTRVSGLNPLVLDVYVVEHRPEFVVELNAHSGETQGGSMESASYQSSTRWLISDEGVFLAQLATLNSSEMIVLSSRLPRISLVARIDDPSGYLQLEKALLQIHNCIAVGGLPFEVDEYRLSADGDGALFIAPLESFNEPAVVLYARSIDEAERALNRLNYMMSDLKRKGEKAERIDLRFHARGVIHPLPAKLDETDMHINSGSKT